LWVQLLDVRRVQYFVASEYVTAEALLHLNNLVLLTNNHLRPTEASVLSALSSSLTLLHGCGMERQGKPSQSKSALQRITSAGVHHQEINDGMTISWSKVGRHWQPPPQSAKATAAPTTTSRAAAATITTTITVTAHQSVVLPLLDRLHYRMHGMVATQACPLHPACLPSLAIDRAIGNPHPQSPAGWPFGAWIIGRVPSTATSIMSTTV
jgi:hypothetical protein